MDEKKLLIEDGELVERQIKALKEKLSPENVEVQVGRFRQYFESKGLPVPERAELVRKYLDFIKRGLKEKNWSEGEIDYLFRKAVVPVAVETKGLSWGSFGVIMVVWTLMLIIGFVIIYLWGMK